MVLAATEEAFLAGHRLGRLATVGPSGGPQVKPVGFAYNHELGTIDISGFNMAQSAKYRNVQRHPEVANNAAARRRGTRSWRSSRPPPMWRWPRSAGSPSIRTASR